MPSSSPGSWFPGEEFLQVELPNYNADRSTLTWLLAFNFIFWIAIFPVILDYVTTGSDEKRVKKNNADIESDPHKRSEPTSSSPEKKRRSSRNKKQTSGESRPASITPQETEESEEEQFLEPRSDIPSTLGVMVFTFLILMVKNPHNSFSSRRVFMAPLLSRAECDHIMNMANSAAKKNYERAINSAHDEGTSTDNRKNYEVLQREPHGWQKNRHGAYPTTDLNLVTDPFTREDRSWISHRLDSRLSPLLERTFGIPASSIRANDMFVVRYDAVEGGGHRQYLRNHTDSSDISFNILLNDDFEGGGTRFWDRLEQQPFAHVQPKEPGTVLLHSALINHEGAAVTKGTRMILVGFLSVDRIDPFDNSVNTGLSWQASWACWPWLAVKFKQAYGLRSGRTEKEEDAHHWTDNNKYVKGFLRDMMSLFQKMDDAFATHAVVDLVSDKDADEFMYHLDEAHAKQAGHRRGRGAVWWLGQNIHIDITGKVGKEWDSRKQKAEDFEDL